MLSWRAACTFGPEVGHTLSCSPIIFTLYFYSGWIFYLAIAYKIPDVRSIAIGCAFILVLAIAVAAVGLIALCLIAFSSRPIRRRFLVGFFMMG